MAGVDEKTKEPADRASGRKGVEKHNHGADETCRCKEASNMTPRELLELMFKDLAFWKKPKKNE